MWDRTLNSWFLFLFYIFYSGPLYNILNFRTLYIFCKKLLFATTTVLQTVRDPDRRVSSRRTYEFTIVGLVVLAQASFKNAKHQNSQRQCVSFKLEKANKASSQINPFQFNDLNVLNTRWELRRKPRKVECTANLCAVSGMLRRIPNAVNWGH